MTTQTLRGMAHHGPMHWRGDRTGGSFFGDPQGLDERLACEAFNGAFASLLGRDEGEIPAADMQSFADFVLSIVLPPNPIRSLDDQLTAAQANGRNIFLNQPGTDVISSCTGCHTLDAAQGFFGTSGLTTFEDEPQELEVPHLNNAYQKIGMFGTPNVAFVDVPPEARQHQGGRRGSDPSRRCSPRGLCSVRMRRYSSSSRPKTMSNRVSHLAQVGSVDRTMLAGQVTLNVLLLLVGVYLTWWANRRAMVLVAFVPLLFVPFSYARVRAHRVVQLHLPSSLVLPVAMMGVAFDAIMAAQVVTARQPSGLSVLQAAGITWIGAVWFSAHVLLLLGYGLIGLVRLASRPARAWFGWSRPPWPREGEPVLGRRELLQKAGLVGVAVPFGVSLSSVPLSYDFRVEEREIVLPFWPAALDGLRVAHLSDIHVGGSMNRQRLRRVVALTNQCRPDLVLHSGDFLTHRSGDFDVPLYEALAQVRAPYGQWACLGNHDFDDPQRLERRLRDCGVTVLRDRVAALRMDGQPLEIAGMDFRFERAARAAAYARLVAGWGPRGGTPRVVLNHDPSGFVELPDGCADLVLSGHTHGGHIGVQLGSSRAITVVGLAGLPDQGLFGRAGMRLYVTRCVGFYGYPMRIGIPPEIALLVLRAPTVVGRAPTAARSL